MLKTVLPLSDTHFDLSSRNPFAELRVYFKISFVNVNH